MPQSGYPLTTANVKEDFFNNKNHSKKKLKSTNGYYLTN